MSLINEALKKAQKEGNGKDAPAARSPDVTSAARNGRKPGGAAIAAGVVVILAVAGGAGYYFTRDEPTPVISSTAPVQTTETKPVAEGSGVAKSTETPVSPATSTSETTKPVATTPPVGEIAKPTETTTKATEPVTVKPVGVPVTPVAPVTPSAPVRNPEITEMIGRMNVSFGRKKTGRCVIDTVMFKVGDQLSPSPVINIKAITDTEVVFSDANGVEYSKKYK